MQWTLYYRPRTFADIVGQSHVTKVLTRYVELQSFPVGVTFQGSRGTGKTTTARILGKVLNCDVPVANDPCGICASCKRFAEGTSTGVIEIDAASHGLVDDVRELRDLLDYSHQDKYRVVIIDEAHSLSTAACNALLKTLEEPPPHTLFVLATTEPTRIIETVRSRLTPFEFRRLTSMEIEGRLKFILDDQGITTYNIEALSIIAKRVDGGMRDAIVLLEQLHSYGKGITEAACVEYFGVVGRPLVEQCLWHVVRGDHQQGIEVIRDFFNRSSEGQAFIDSLIELLRDMLLFRFGAKVSVDEGLCQRFDIPIIIKMLDTLYETQNRIGYTRVSSALVELLYAKLVGIVGVTVNLVSPSVGVVPKGTASVLRGLGFK